jgi:hypothetical protein
VLRIEFSRPVADRAIARTSGVTLPVGYRLHVRRTGIATTRGARVAERERDLERSLRAGDTEPRS